ncbi:MAG: pyridoxal phosphate-dependent aminotransferase family protein [Candidatus Gastranaerophilales bacterium]|nr:pyridoxal phosphate-dependent aminotransferase family protein [Candidatus Gastranaerophilales bacterium]
MKDLKNSLKKLKQESLFREIKNINSKTGKYICIEGKNFLNLSSNNYLNFADNTDFVKEFLEHIKSKTSEVSFGSASARLLTGNLPVYDRLESLIANLFNKEKCLLFNSGYHANVGIVSSLLKKGDAIFCDKLNHASIIDGMKLGDGDFFRYKHFDYEDLEYKLEKYSNKYKNIYIITESVFSMDGDIADLKKIVEIKKKYNATLIVDEAHAFGVFGKNGLGICEQENILNEVDIIIATFGKSIGGVGAFAVATADIINYFINTSRSFIFSTAIAPVNILWNEWIIENKLPETLTSRQNMLQTADKFRNLLTDNGFETRGESQIVPVIIGNNEDTMKMADNLQQYGYWALPIRPPTVPKNTSRLRFSLTTDINIADIEGISTILRQE